MELQLEGVHNNGWQTLPTKQTLFFPELHDDEFWVWCAVLLLTFLFAWAPIKKHWPNKNGSYRSVVLISVTCLPQSKKLTTRCHSKKVTFQLSFILENYFFFFFLIYN